jgi:Cu(I)/Ag(I) efflux system membrane protein CusA/SilA
VHTPLLSVFLRWRKIALVAVLSLLALTIYPISKLGSEFMPPLDEGDILYMPTTFPGVSITKAKELLQQTDKILRTFPETESVFGKVGRAETATDPAPLSMLETIVRLKDRDQWPNPDKTTQELMQEMDAAIKFPGLANAWTMPIKTRIDMLSTGIKTPVGIKISGPDLTVLQDISKNVERIMKTIPDTLSAFGDRAVGGYFLDFDIDREKAARYGLTVGDIQDVIMTAIGGMQVTETIEGLERYPVNIRYPRDLRDNPEQLSRVLIPTPYGAQVPLRQLAHIELRRGAPAIKSEDSRPNAWVYVDLKTSDVGGFVAEAKRVLGEKLEIPPGYAINWSGQYEYMERASARLKLVIPLTLFLIFLLLYLNFRNVSAPAVVMTSVPFALIGGFWFVYWYGFNISVAIAVGFIALAGVAVETGVLVLTFIDEAINERQQQKRHAHDIDGKSTARLTRDEIINAVHEGTSRRVRPVVMTATSTMIGLLPIMLLTGTGSDVMRRIAAPMVGGMLTTTLLCLLILPVIYTFVLQWKAGRAPNTE